MAMKMSAFGCIVALVALSTSLQFKVQAASIDESIRQPRSFYPENAFLAGELTPVWLAHSDKPGHIVYERLEVGIVKKALDYFKSNKFHGIVRNRRDIQENITFPEVPENKPHSYQAKRAAGEEDEFLYPSLLVSMEYQNDWPTNKDAQDKLIYDKILYALAYWNAVDIELRPIRHPGVRIRIAGIVIGRDKDVTPTGLKIQSAGLRIYDSLHSILIYWDKIRRQNADFREGTFNIVASMTDTTPLILTSYGWSLSYPNCDSSYSPAGNTLHKFTGLMVYDDNAFYGIKQTVAEVAHIMGRRYTGARASVDAASFTEDDLRHIKYALNQNASCWKAAEEVHSPGKPVDTILPEDILRI